MAQTGNFSPIQLYSSSTPGNAPAVGNLVNSTLGSELAINIADGKLFYKDSANAIQVIAWKTTPTTAGGTGLTSYSAGDMVYWASGTAFSKLTIGSANYIMTSSGTAPQWSASIGPAQGGTGITSYAVGDLIYASGTTTLSKLADVVTGNALISGGVATAPSWGKIGLTTHISGTLPTANGGTNLTSFTANGLVYASSTSALATGSALTFDGTNLSATNSVTSINTFGYKNRLMNGSMECISYGASGTVANSTAIPTSSTGYVTVDRWFMYATGATLPVLQFKSTSSGIYPYLTLITGATGNTLFGIGQRIEDVNCCDMINKTCTLSAYLGGNGVTTITWTAYYANTANTFGTIGTPTKTQIATGTFTISGTTARYSAQISVPAAAYTGIEILFTAPGVPNGGNFAITNVQFEVGSQATSYDYRSIQQEYPLVMRYRENGVYRWRGYDSGVIDVLTNPFKVYKYATPTVSVATSNIYLEAFTIALTGAPYDTGSVAWTATSEIA